jgi:hypothetical protein
MKREAFLNRLSRRGFMGSAVVVFIALNGTILLAADEDATAHQALSLVRTLVTDAHTLQADLGRWPSKLEILKMLQDDVQKLGSKAPPWVAMLDFESEELLRGWNFDYHSRTDGFVFTISRKIAAAPRDVFITDEIGLIYHTTVSGPLPKANALKTAKEFPGAVPFNEDRPAVLRK